MKKTEMMNLIRKAKDRDPDAFTTLMQQYTKDMYRVAIAILRSRSCLETFLLTGSLC